MKKGIILITAGLLSLQHSYATIVINSKPGPAAGIDAPILTGVGGCKTTDRTIPHHLTNFGNDSVMNIMTWTWNAIGCSSGTGRFLIKFSDIGTIPPGSTIIKAKMVLYHPHATAISATWGNNYFPGTTLTNTNPGTVYLVDRSSAGVWAENTVTWANAPAPETTLSAPIDVTNSRWDGADTIDVTSLVQSISSNGGVDHGFYVKLNTEVYYREQAFASSDYADPSLWPELHVEYVPPTYCNANFTFAPHAGDPYAIDCTPADYTAQWYSWTIDGDGTGATPGIIYMSPLSLSYSFGGAGCHKICHYASGPSPRPTCGVCYNICIDANGQSTYTPARLAAPEATNTANPQLWAVPNPASNQVIIHAAIQLKNIRIVSMSGVSQLEIKDLQTTDYQLDISTLAPGVYFAEAQTAEGQVINCKLTKQ